MEQVQNGIHQVRESAVMFLRDPSLADDMLLHKLLPVLQRTFQDIPEVIAIQVSNKLKYCTITVYMFIRKLLNYVI